MIEELSVRSNNICLWNNLNDINAIIQYYRKFNDFSGLRKCGKKSNEELIKLCHKYGYQCILKTNIVSFDSAAVNIFLVNAFAVNFFQDE